MAKKKAAPKAEKVETTEDRLKKQFGDDILVSGRYITEQKKTIVPISPHIDGMLGGGIRFGSFVIPTGPPKVGKTSMALDMAGTALNIPTEFDEPRHLYFFNIEGRLNDRDLLGIRHLIPHVEADHITVIKSKPGKILHAENYLEMGEILINEKPGSIFIFDSFSQLCSKSGREKEWDDGKAYRDDVPKFLSQFCKRISNVIPINQSIVVGVTHRIANTGFGFTPWAEASGTKIQYAVDVKVNAPFCKPWLSGETKIGQTVHWDCLCSSLINGESETSCVSKLRFGYGIDKPGELADIAVDLGFFKRTAPKSSWYEFEGKKIQGIDKLRDILVEDPALYDQINEKYRDMMGLPECKYTT